MEHNLVFLLFIVCKRQSDILGAFDIFSDFFFALICTVLETTFISYLNSCISRCYTCLVNEKVLAHWLYMKHQSQIKKIKRQSGC